MESSAVVEIQRRIGEVEKLVTLWTLAERRGKVPSVSVNLRSLQKLRAKLERELQFYRNAGTT